MARDRSNVNCGEVEGSKNTDAYFPKNAGRRKSSLEGTVAVFFAKIRVSLPMILKQKGQRCSGELRGLRGSRVSEDERVFFSTNDFFDIFHHFVGIDDGVSCIRKFYYASVACHVCHF